MNLLGEPGRQLAKAGFDGLAKVLKQIVFVWFVGPGAVLFTGRLLAVARRFLEEVFAYVVRVARIGVQDAAFGQVRGHGPQPGLVGFGTGVDVKVDRDAVGRGDDLHLEAVEPAPLAGAAPVVRLAFEQLTARDARPKCLTRILWHTATGNESMT